jgi:hypothetical protein
MVNFKCAIAKLPALNHINGRNWPTSGLARSVSAMGAWQYLKLKGMCLYVTLTQNKLIPIIKT